MAMKTETLKIGRIPAIIWGEPADRLYIYIHGKMGYKEEAEEFAHIACRKGWQVLSFDLPGHGERKDESDRFFPWYITPEMESIWEYAVRTWSRIANGKKRFPRISAKHCPGSITSMLRHIPSEIGTVRRKSSMPAGIILRTGIPWTISAAGSPAVSP